MKKAMISQPMAGKSDQEIVYVRERAVAVLRGMGYEVVDTLFEGDFYSDEQMKERGIAQIPLYFLAKSLESMSLCDTVYFCKGWENARGCKFEHAIAGAYGLNIVYEDGEQETNSVPSHSGTKHRIWNTEEEYEEFHRQRQG